jgi:sugar lactone lactonase YvrE/DNA-binding IclR family transcriptional regulator
MISERKSRAVPTGAAAFAKGLDVLSLIGSSPNPLRFSEIQKSSGITKPTLARILRTLLAYRLIQQNEENNCYRLGSRFLELGHRAWEVFDLRSAASSELDRLLILTGETVVVNQLEGDAIQCLDFRVSGGLKVQVVQNQRSPLHSTSTGKALLAFLPSSTQLSMIDGIDFERFTAKTICDIQSFRAELAVTQARGYAISVEEHLEDVSSVAAPIHGPNGIPIGALAVAGPSSRLNADKLHATGRDLMAASRRITGIAGTVALDSRPRPVAVRTRSKQVDHLLHCGNQLGEGPVWSVAEQRLYWVDILETAVHRFAPATGLHEICNLPKLVSAIVLTDQNKILAATQDGLEFLDFSSGELIPYVDPEPIKPGNRLWVGSMRLDVSRADGSLYRVGAGRISAQIESGFTAANGLDWSPDGKTFYFVDTIPGHIYAYDFAIDEGKVSNRRIFASVPEMEGRPDGLAVDSEGYVWCAIWDGWRIDRYTPDGIKHNSLEVPVPRPTSITFGGEDLGTMYITSARVRLPSETLTKAPNSGDLFAIRPGVCGREPNLFRE